MQDLIVNTMMSKLDFYGKHFSPRALPPDWCCPHLKLGDVVAEGDVEGPVLGLLAQPGLVHLQCLVSCIVFYHYQY